MEFLDKDIVYIKNLHKFKKRVHIVTKKIHYG